MITLQEFIFLQEGDLKLVSLHGCEEDSFEIELDDEVVIDCNDIASDVEELFFNSKIRIMRTENPYNTIVDSGTGRVLGASVISYELPDDYDEFDHGNGIVTFSVAVDQEFRGQRLAERLIRDIMNNHRRQVIKAQVINSIMEKILINLGFVKVSESGSREGLVYQLKR